MVKNITFEKRYKRWTQIMKAGEYTGCHQMPARSFFIQGYQFPICARCTGVLIGHLAALPCFIKFGFLKTTAYSGCCVMFADWSIQQFLKKESNNKRRLITGIAGGFGIMMIQLSILKKIVHNKKSL